MKWVYRTLMAASVVGGAVVTAGLLPVAFATVFAATGTAAAFFHEAPGASAK
jgi:hypothetical protein